MKTIQQIHQETPLSLTNTDNPIYEIDLTEINEESILVCVKNSQELVTLKTGDKLRLLGCKLTEPSEEDNNPNSLFRWKSYDIVMVPFKVLKYIEGELGDQFTDIYENELTVK